MVKPSVTGWYRVVEENEAHRERKLGEAGDMDLAV